MARPTLVFRNDKPEQKEQNAGGGEDRDLAALHRDRAEDDGASQRRHIRERLHAGAKEAARRVLQEIGDADGRDQRHQARCAAQRAIGNALGEHGH
jgi:hypothetical protein